MNTTKEIQPPGIARIIGPSDLKEICESNFVPVSPVADVPSDLKEIQSQLDELDNRRKLLDSAHTEARRLEDERRRPLWDLAAKWSNLDAAIQIAEKKHSQLKNLVSENEIDFEKIISHENIPVVQLISETPFPRKRNICLDNMLFPHVLAKWEAWLKQNREARAELRQSVLKLADELSLMEIVPPEIAAEPSQNFLV